MKSLSIKDIANLANVSITTVSFILNGKAREKRISEDVIKKVEDIIKEHHYSPNLVARSLRTGNTKIIGLIVEDISNPFFSGIARFIEDKAYKKGYKISYSSTENNLNKAKDLISMYKLRQADAYIVAPVPGIEEDIQLLLDDNKPVVLFDRNLPGLQTNYVGVNHFNGTYEATSHLINQKKKKKIAFITVDLDVEQVNDRFNGYKQALSDSGIALNEDLVVKIPFNQSAEDTEKQLTLFFEHNKDADSALFATNYLAISGLVAFKTMGKNINDQFEIVAYDDHDIFKLHTPAITAVYQPIEEIAEKIIDLVLERLTSKSKVSEKSRSYILPTKLIVR